MKMNVLMAPQVWCRILHVDFYFLLLCCALLLHSISSWLYGTRTTCPGLLYSPESTLRICLSVCVPSFLFLSPHLLDYSSREPSVSSSHPIPASHAQPSYHPPSSNGSGGITEREEVRLSARMFVHCFFRPMSHTLSFSPLHLPSTVIIFTHTFRSFLFFSFFSLFLFIFFTSLFFSFSS